MRGRTWGEDIRFPRGLPAVAEDAQDGLDSILPADLFALGVGAGGVGDGDFGDAQRERGEFGSDFGLKAEALLTESERLGNPSGEDFVAGFHVGQGQTGGRIAEGREPLVAEAVKAEELGRGGGEARAVDHVGLVVLDWGEEFDKVGGVVFEIGVLNHEEVPGRRGDAGAERSALALVHGVAEEFEFDAGLVGEGWALQDGCEDGAGAVGGRVVDDHELEVERDFKQARDDGLDGASFIEDWHDDGELQGK